MNSQEEIQQMVEDFKQTKEEFTEKMTKKFNEFFKNFFDKNPEISVVKWQQYTPYFNDGDECVFRTYFYDVLELDSNMPEEDYKRLSAIQNDLEKTLKSIPKEIYKDMFGDHCQVTATVDGFDVIEYEHD